MWVHKSSGSFSDGHECQPHWASLSRAVSACLSLFCVSKHPANRDHSSLLTFLPSTWHYIPPLLIYLFIYFPLQPMSPMTAGTLFCSLISTRSKCMLAFTENADSTALLLILGFDTVLTQ